MKRRSDARWTAALLLILGLVFLMPATFAGAGDDPGGQTASAPSGEESTTVEPAPSPGWMFLILSSALGTSAALALWRRL